MMVASRAVREVKVEDYVFPPAVKAPGSDNPFFLGDGSFVKITAIGIYLEDKAVTALTDKWQDKEHSELTESVDFFRDIVTGPFEKFIQVTMISPLTGEQYSKQVTETFIAFWKENGIYSQDEMKAVDKFREAFMHEKLPPDRSILFTQSPTSLTIAFSKHDTIPEQGKVVIENKKMSEAVCYNPSQGGMQCPLRQTTI